MLKFEKSVLENLFSQNQSRDEDDSAFNETTKTARKTIDLLYIDNDINSIIYFYFMKSYLKIITYSL